MCIVSEYIVISVLRVYEMCFDKYAGLYMETENE